MAIARYGTLPLRSMTVALRGISPSGAGCGSVFARALALVAALVVALVLALLGALALVPKVFAPAIIHGGEVALTTVLLQLAISVYQSHCPPMRPP